MLNFSLSNFAIGASISISAAISKGNIRFSAENIACRRSFSPFWYSSGEFHLRESCFRDFLSNVIVSEATKQQRMTDTNVKSSINQAVFDNLGLNTVYGGAIYVTTQTSLEIKNSLFTNCTSKTFGGAIYYTGGSIQLVRVCFSWCYLKDNIDRNYGKITHIKNSDAILEDICAEQCAPYHILGGDSGFYLDTGLFSLYFLNFTHSRDTQGALSLCMFHPSAGSIQHFCQMVNSASCLNGQELWYCDNLETTFMNYANLTSFSFSIVESLYCTTVLEKCVFKDIKDSIYLRTYNSGHFVLLDVVSNVDISGATIINDPQTYIMHVSFKYGCIFAPTSIFTSPIVQSGVYPIIMLAYLLDLSV